MRYHRFLIRMLLFLAAVGALLALLFPTIKDALFANPILNGLILFVLVVGTVLNIRQVLRLTPELQWIESFRSHRPDTSTAREPRLLAPIAQMLDKHRTHGRLTISAMAMRSMVDGLAARLDESRDISRYFIGLSVFLGLLGTFWGLLQTVASVSDVIDNLSISGEDLEPVFNELKENLRSPLEGMGTAFSSSLLGLGGSLVLGFLDLQSGQAQNQFYNDFEEWLSSQARLSSGSGGGDIGGDSVPAYVSALLEQTAESVAELQRTLARAEESRITSSQDLNVLNDTIRTLAEQMRIEQKTLLKVAENQAALQPILQRMANEGGGTDGSAQSLRNIEHLLSRIANDQAEGRADVIREMRSEIKFLARTIAAIADETNQ